MALGIVLQFARGVPATLVLFQYVKASSIVCFIDPPALRVFNRPPRGRFICSPSDELEETVLPVLAVLPDDNESPEDDEEAESDDIPEEAEEAEDDRDALLLRRRLLRLMFLYKARVTPPRTKCAIGPEEREEREERDERDERDDDRLLGRPAIVRFVYPNVP
jgi:hypothetical protein